MTALVLALTPDQDTGSAVATFVLFILPLVAAWLWKQLRRSR